MHCSAYAKDQLPVIIVDLQDVNLIVAAEKGLKEQYPVTAHAPNFDFWTGCREIKRCEESKRTLKIRLHRA